MKILNKFWALMLVMVCLCTLVVPASAANVVAVIDAGDFGTLTGTLYDSTASIDYSEEGYEVFFYEFSYGTRITRSPIEWATIHTYVELYNLATGAYLYSEGSVWTCENGNLRSGYYVELDDFPAVRGANGITVVVYGCHEVRGYDGYAAYTSKNYNLQRDHRII